MERVRATIAPLVEAEIERSRRFRTAESSGNLASPSPFAETWKKEKVCFLCQEKVGTGRGDTKKRRGCKFCSHAVCEKCAPIKSLHPLTNEEERICVACFKGKLEQNLRSEFNSLLAGKNAELRSLEEQLSQEIETRTEQETLRRQVEKELSELQSKPSIPEETRLQLESESARARSLERSLTTLQADFSRLEQESAYEKKSLETSLLSERQNIDKMRKVQIFKNAELSGNKKEVEKLKKQLEDLQKQLGAGETGLNAVLLSTKETHAAEKLELQKQLYAANETVKEKESEIKRLTTTLKDTQETNNQTIKRLQDEHQESLRQFETRRSIPSNQVSTLQSQSSVNDSDLRSQYETLKVEFSTLQAQLAERDSLLSLAKEDLVEEYSRRTALEDFVQRKSRKSDLDSDLDTLKAEFVKRVEQWKLFQEEVRGVLVSRADIEKALRIKIQEYERVAVSTPGASDKFRMEIEQYKTQLLNCHQTIAKFDEVFKVVQEKLHLEQEMIQDKEREVEALKQLLETHGITLPTLSADQETGCDLSNRLKDREETIERLNVQLKECKEEMKKLKNDRFRRSRPSGVPKNSTPRPPLSQDPCDCSVF